MGARVLGVVMVALGVLLVTFAVSEGLPTCFTLQCLDVTVVTLAIFAVGIVLVMTGILKVFSRSKPPTAPAD